MQLCVSSHHGTFNAIARVLSTRSWLIAPRCFRTQWITRNCKYQDYCQKPPLAIFTGHTVYAQRLLGTSRRGGGLIAVLKLTTHRRTAKHGCGLTSRGMNFEQQNVIDIWYSTRLRYYSGNRTAFPRTTSPGSRYISAVCHVRGIRQQVRVCAVDPRKLFPPCVITTEIACIK